MELVKDLKPFSVINAERCESSKGFNMQFAATPLGHFALGIAGEAGEVAEIVKKLDRGFNEREQKKFYAKLSEKERLSLFAENGQLEVPFEVVERRWRNALEIKLGRELADVYSYLDLMASKINIDLKTLVLLKFNVVSEEMGCYDEFHIESIDQI